jgi:hypothetical protein
MNIIVYGAGDQGRAARRILESQGFVVTVFADGDLTKVSRGHWEGVKIIGFDELRQFDKSTPVIIGIGAGRLDLLKQIDNMLIDWGFTQIFWSAAEMIAALYPNHKWKDIFSAHKIEITTRVGCPIYCRACPQQLFVSKYKQYSNKFIMSIEDFNEYMSKIPKDVEIVFTGFTEPFYNFYCSDFITLAFEKGHKVSLGTTLVGVTNEIFDKIKDFVFLDITLHLPDKEKNSLIPVNDDYLHILKLFMQIHWKNKENYINYRRFSIHGELEEKTKAVLLDIGFDADNMLNICETLHDRAGNINFDFKEKYPINIKKSQNIFCDFPYYANWHKFRDYGEINQDDLLFIHNFHLFILFPNGDCTLCSSDFGLRHIFGNLLLDNYTGLYKNNKIYDTYMMAMQNGGDCLCRNCFLAAPYDKLKIVTRSNYING